tara:strand:+ start:98887 stop:99627 length:741 start_codon:yes stop_codon:yes gene_type:complete
MLRQIFYPGLLAGLIAGVFIFGVQQIELIPLILQAEVYEGVSGDGLPDEGFVSSESPVTREHIDADGRVHEQERDPWAPGDGFERIAFSFVSNVISGVGFGLILSAAIILSRRQYSWRQGVIWGLAGFVAVHLAPAFSLPPELPGMASEADLLARQIFAIATTAFTVAGLGLIAFGRGLISQFGGAFLIVLPHFYKIERVAVEHAVPAELVGQFVVSSLVVTGLFWMLLGGLTARFIARVQKWPSA